MVERAHWQKLPACLAVPVRKSETPFDVERDDGWGHPGLFLLVTSSWVGAVESCVFIRLRPSDNLDLT